MQIQQAKTIIYNFLKNKIAVDYPKYFRLTNNACSKLFWDRVKQEKPTKPYIMLSDANISKIYRRFETFVQDGRQYIRKEMRLLVTFGVYTLKNSDNLSDADALCTELIEYIQNLFTETQSTFDTLYAQGITVNELESSEIRDLSQFSQTNQEFRKEIDIAFEYDDITTYTPELAKGLEVDINISQTDNSIKMEITNERI